ncbi:flagellar assembly protein FliX [Maritalea sp.]|jgi:polysaccharide pyruvyl transferase WcaK-like protein|uniref:flagellar assembly protein FliX n=1 Tax=Maritalea sp. TaxID=2003361 RepID=UPI0039E2FD1C
MRITDANRLNRTTQKSSKKSGQAADSAFSVPSEDASTAKSETTAPSHDVGGIDALLALQAVEDPTFARKKSIKRGHDLLDSLEQIKTDLLVGQISESRLDNMLNMVKKARNNVDPSLDSIIDNIELRVRVELAKFSKYK